MHSLSLKLRITALAFISAIAPLLIFQGINATRTAGNLQSAAAMRLESQAVLVASGIQRYLRQLLTQTQLIAISDTLVNSDTEAKRQLIGKIKGENRYFDAFHLADLQGNILVSTAGSAEEGFLAWDIHLGIKELFSEATAAKSLGVYVSEAHLVGLGPEIILVAPLFLAGKPSLILLVEANSIGIQELVSDFGEHDIGSKQTYVVDKFGRVIVSTDRLLATFDNLHDVRDQPAMLGDNVAGSVTYRNREEVETVAGYADLTETGVNAALDWTVICLTTRQEVLAPALGTQKVLLYSGLVVVAMVILLAYLFARGITQPLQRTVQLAEEIRMGNYSHRLEANIGGEIGRLANAINGMADRVEERTAEIITRNEKLTSEIVERKLAQDRLKKLSHKIIRLQEEERRRVSRELHDGINQLLVSVKFKLEAFESKFTGKGPEELRDIRLASTFLDEAIAEVRRVSHALRPSVLDDLGLSPAVANLARQFGDRNQIDMEVAGLESETDQRLPADVETAMYRIVQEALMNIEKHANATKVIINMTHTDTSVTIRIEDNGEGFNLPQAMRKTRSTQSMGLRNMRERIELLQGTFFIHSDIGQGTFLEIQAPLNLE